MKLNCYIVRDLLPSYIENLTSGETKEDIQKHLERCMECRGVYEDMNSDIEDKREEGVRRPDCLNFLSKLKGTLLHKTGFGLAVILFVFLRFFSVFENVSSFVLYEAEFYILLVSAACLFAWKDLFHWEMGASKRFYSLYVLHAVTFLISGAVAIGMYRLFGMGERELEHLLLYLGPKAGVYISMMLQGMMIGLSVIVVYGLYTSIIKSGKYYSLVCHGLGSLVMMCSLLYTLRSLNLPVNYGVQLMPGHLIPYGEGIVLSVLYCFYSINYMHCTSKDGEKGGEEKSSV